MAALLRDFDQDFGDWITTAILISMTPREYQDMVFQLGTPVHMNIGQVGQGKLFGHDAATALEEMTMKDWVRKAAVEVR